MTTPVFHLRSESELGPPTNTSGSPRPLLPMRLPILTAHYSGVRPDQVSYSQSGRFADDRAVALHLANLERVARNAGKPYEYNAVIPAMLDPNAAHVWAYADEYQAAHSAGENAIAYGVQFPNGIDQPLTAGQIRAFRWWHAVMVAAGRLAPVHQVLPHRQMPDAATICPGPAILADWPRLIEPYQEDPGMPANITADPGAPIVALYAPNTAAWKPALTKVYSPCTFVLLANGTVRRAVNPDVELAGRYHAPTLFVDSPEQYDELHRASGTKYPGRPQ